MNSSGGCLRGLIILSVLAALSLGAAVAVNAPVSIGTNIIKIININYMDIDQWIEMSNEGTGSFNLNGWTIANMKNQSWSFPANFTLNAGSIVKVHAGKGKNTASDLYNSKLVWNSTGDAATLKDATGKIISEYKYPINASALGKAANIKPPFIPKRFSIGASPTYQAIEADYNAKRGSLKSDLAANLSGRPFICHGGPLNWAWTTGL